MGITKDLAEYTAAVKFDDLPPKVVRLAKQLVLDEIGCAFGGLSTDAAGIFIDHVKDVGGKEEVTIVGVRDKVPCAAGAGVNASLAIMLDYDETYRNYTHPASVLVPAAIAMAERQDVPGKDLISSVVTAYEVVTRIADAVRASPEYRSRNWNGSSYAFGAMVAAAKTLGLDENQISSAIGITGYTTPLVNVNLWLRALPISPIKGAWYWQCKAGIEGALLAQRGFMGPPGLLDEKDWGFWAGVSDRCDWNTFTHKLGEEYYLERYLTFKPWPCCRWLHPGIEMILSLLEEGEINPVDIEEIVYKQDSAVVSSPTFHVSLPKDSFQAMYSAPWALATMALGYEPGPDWFAKERQDDPRVRKLVERIRLEEDPEVTQMHNEHPEKSFAKLILKANGRVYQRQTEYAKGDPEKPMTQEELERKFSSMARRVISDKQVKKIIDIVNHLEALGNTRELTRQFS